MICSSLARRLSEKSNNPICQNGQMITGCAPEIDGPVNAIVTRGNTLYIGGNFWSVNGQDIKIPCCI